MNGKINFDHIVQRSYVWERSRKSALIESMIIGYPVPPVFAKRIDNGTGHRGSNTYYIMDGKQRLSTIKEYLNDEFALTELTPVSYMDDEIGEECTVDISEKKFSELPEALQNYLNTVTVSVTYFDSLTKEEERELFKRLNAGKPLSTKSRMLASCKDIEGLLDIGSHKLFMEMLTDKARANKNQVAMVMKCWCMMNMKINDISFESKVFNPMLEETEISETEKLAMIEVFNLIVDTHESLLGRNNKKVAKKLYTETHLVSLIPYFAMSVENNIVSEMMADWLTEFFDTTEGASISTLYNEASGSGSAKSANIIDRDDALSDSYKEFFKIDEEYNSNIINEAEDDAVFEDDNDDVNIDEIIDEID
ncbi:MAG: DUF262 domain-containing protein [Bacteroidales bacterium]|nr:DUF262 domain-containing protein [Bacteroidales bacterium]